ncbi:Uma2 family endonuclease [Candidatus Poribacteria bacterium]|nr:Uma2 family endonuclease [Candidatus Poribacteria bacterium]
MSQTVSLDLLKKALPLRRFTVSEYHRMIEVSILTEDERVELMDGVILKMNPKRTRHSVVTSQIAKPFYPLVLNGKAVVRVQDPIMLNDDTEPEPDVVVVKPREDAYLSAHPSPSDVFLVIEVSDTTLAFDTEIKLPRYAASGIPEVWIVNLVDDRIEVYRDPIKLPDGTSIYRVRTNVVKGETLAPQAFSSLKIAVDEVLI